MTATMQVLLGSALLLVCSAIHLALLVGTVRLMKHVGSRFSRSRRGHHWGMLVVLAFVAVVLAHTIQVWLWAISLVSLSALTSLPDTLYFALVTYTTVGYGDVIVGEGFRLYGAMAAVTGLLNFGLSTAFLVGLLAQLLPAEIERE